MKARVKATGEIVNINEFCTLNDSGERTYYWANSLELITRDNPDYWTRLEHQAAIAAMQGLLNNNLLSSVLFKTGTTHEDYINEVVKVAKEYAHALVQKMKEEK